MDGETPSWLYPDSAIPDLLPITVGKPKSFLADKGDDGDFLCEELLVHGMRPIIPPKANRKNPPVCDFPANKDRNRIQRMLNCLKQFRRVATRYDNTRHTNSAQHSALSPPLKYGCPAVVNMTGRTTFSKSRSRLYFSISKIRFQLMLTIVRYKWGTQTLILDRHEADTAK